MTQDDLYQVIYECSECGEILAIDDTSLRAIEQEFERLGWFNEEQEPGHYVVTCPQCILLALRNELEMIKTQDDFLAGTGRW